jgi:hypothetical protein
MCGIKKIIEKNSRHNRPIQQRLAIRITTQFYKR